MPALNVFVIYESLCASLSSAKEEENKIGGSGACRALLSNAGIWSCYYFTVIARDDDSPRFHPPAHLGTQ